MANSIASNFRESVALATRERNKTSGSLRRALRGGSWRRIRFGFFEEDDFLKPRFAVGDDQLRADLVAGCQRFGLFGNGDHVAPGHRGHQSWNVAMFYGDELLRQFNRDHFGLDGVMFLDGLGFTPRQDGNQDSRGQHPRSLPAS